MPRFSMFESSRGRWVLWPVLWLMFQIGLVSQTPPPPAKRLPPAGIEIDPTARRELSAALAAFGGEIQTLGAHLRERPELLRRLPDVEIFYKAVDWALRYDEFFDPKQVAFARTLLEQGSERARKLGEGQTPWLDANGLIVRGYRSQLDGSIQPYGLFVPPGLDRQHARTHPLLVWPLGRNDKRTELAFLGERERPGLPFEPAGTVVLIPYGRFCNATKFAGEADVFEGLDHVRNDYHIDEHRIAVAGFSMGGASVWHLAAHHAARWCVASPGAGFAETAIYTKALAAGKEAPPWWEQKLWTWYDATTSAANLFNCPTIAYSGEIDPQKQSADLMEKAALDEGVKIERLIGPQTAHKYEPKTRQILAQRLDTLIAKGRDPIPAEVRLTTFTLRYPEMAWVRAEGLERHWERSDIVARREAAGRVVVETKHVTVLHLGLADLREVLIDGQRIEVPKSESASGTTFSKQQNRWRTGALPFKLRKRPGLTGPIEDAFMSSFIFVRPSGASWNPKVGAWADLEMAHAVKMWRDVFRGDAPMMDDRAVIDADIQTKNLVLWGDPSSNLLLQRIVNRLPIEWTAEKLTFNGRTYDAKHCAPILIFPNPLNPERYVVLNSGIDFRDDAYGTNARQTPKLPDWSIIDVDTQSGPRWPGRVLDAGFFDEQWH